jgi:predicted RNA-binding Zn-ribbon protein involved in translation (DUF1610 family)
VDDLAPRAGPNIFGSLELFEWRFVLLWGREMPDTQYSIPCPRCQSRMVWYSAERHDNLRVLQQRYQCEKCGLVSESDDSVWDTRSLRTD